MFTTQSIQSFPVAIAAAVLSAAAMAAPAQAADTDVRTASVMNQNNSVYEETLKFYLHPARLEVIETPRERMDHPAVIIARRAPAGFDWTSAFILHPARLAMASEAPREMMDHPAVIVAKTKQVPSNYTATFTLHPAVAVSKPTQPLYGSATKFIPSTADE